MSHIETIITVFKDLVAVKAACDRLGATFNLGQKTYGWFGRSVGDYPIPEGLTKEDLGKCDHAITIPGNEYEIGLVADKDPTKKSFRLAYDFWGPSGRKLQSTFCNADVNSPTGYTTKLEKLVGAYNTEVLRNKAKAKGLSSFERVGANGKRQLVVNIS